MKLYTILKSQIVLIQMLKDRNYQLEEYKWEELEAALRKVETNIVGKTEKQIKKNLSLRTNYDVIEYINSKGGQIPHDESTNLVTIQKIDDFLDSKDIDVDIGNPKRIIEINKILSNEGFNLTNDEQDYLQDLVNKLKLLDRAFVDKEGNKVGVSYLGKESTNAKSISLQTITEYNRLINDGKFHKLILVLEVNLSSNANAAKSDKIEIFNAQELTYNPTKHVFACKYYLIDEKEKQKLFKELKEPSILFAKLTLNDKVVKYYGWKTGDIIKVYMKNDHPVYDPSINYKIVS